MKESAPAGRPSVAEFFADLDAERRRATESGPSPSPSKRRPQGRPADADSAQTRRNIMAAALQCFGRYGYDRTTNSLIAEHAGISPPTLYHYFDSKPALFQAVADHVTHTFYGRIDELVAERTSTSGRLGAVVVALREQVQENPDLAAFIATYAAEVQRNPEVLRLSPRALWTGPIGFYSAIARDGHAQGDLARDISPEAFGGLAMGLIYGVSLLVSVADSDAFTIEALHCFERLVEGDLFSRSSESTG